MSADNWAVCPRCFDGAQRKADEEKVAVMGTYGTVPVEEFDAAREALVEPKPDDFRTFREDYEFYGAETGVVKVNYRGACTVCGLGVELVDSRKFWPGANDR
jgi:hypothetical protein